MGWGTLKQLAAAIAALVMLFPGARAESSPDRHLLVGRSFAPLLGGGGEPTPNDGPIGDRSTETDQVDAEPDLKQTHLIYFVPADRVDEGLDENGTITRSIDGIRDWFAVQTRREGLASRRPRIDRLPAGGYDITFVRGQQAAAGYTSLDTLAQELGSRGFNAANKRYLVYAAIARGNVCGEGYFPVPGVIEARYAAVYLDSSSTCGARDFGNGTGPTTGKAETIAAHEWLHNEGVASPLAPHHCPISPYHVCTGPLAIVPGDVDPEATDVAFPFINLRLRDKVLDRDTDDYLDHDWPHLTDVRDSPWFE